MRFSRILAAAGLACLALAPAGAALARGRPDSTKAVRYHGLVVRVPRSWPVFDLSRDPQTCVRFDRHAVYLGVPGGQQRCPARAIGRTEAILISPLSASVAALGRESNTSGSALGGRATSFVTHGLEVTATWSQDPGLVAAALGRRSLPPGLGTHVRRAARGPALRPAQSAGSIYTGPAFDACNAPSSAQMSAWLSSPYRALGIYIGGENRACSQPNLTSMWVAAEIAAGWHLIPTYAGLQASGACGGCTTIKPSQASAEGTSDASTAAQEAQALGIPAGSAIYDDMEAYTRGSNTTTVLAYLSAWTTQLHAEGYASGVYTSGASGITDLVNQWGSSYVEPDDIWIAQWNDVESTSSSYVPAADWSEHQRIHQYEGGHNETYGGTTINIDSDYVDAATAGEVLPPPPAPSLSVSPTSTGITNLHPSWPRESGIAYWRVLASASPNPPLAPVGTWGGSQSAIALHGTSPYFAVEALGQSGQVLGTSGVVAAPAHLVVVGKSAYVSATNGSGTVPAGCYIGSACRVVTTISAGRTTIARTSAESFRPNSAGSVRFQLTARGRTMLLHARGGRLGVTVRMRDASGRATSVGIDLVPYSSTGALRTGQIAQSGAVRVVSLTAFTTSGGAGEVLAGCKTAAPCRVTTTMSVGRTVIARPHTGVIGAHEFGYLNVSVTSQGRALLARARGTLPVRVAISDPTGDGAIARVALVRLG